MSTVTRSPPAPGAACPASAHVRWRAAARAARITLSARGASAASRVTSRDTTGSEATGPNSSGSPRSGATSARQSPPSASATTKSVMIFPGLCTRPGRPPPFQRRIQPTVQARDPQRLGQQQATGLGDDSSASADTMILGC